ncbi:hypothetical protein GCM10025857_35990 [Alicyclobacillus contaminans]|nr:hypothetical protein GCM10025857_35990 [Alicyclobacillus contaminans]
MVIGVLSIVVFPWVVYLIIHLASTQPWRTVNRDEQTNLSQMMQAITENERNWTNPRWQAQITLELQREGVAAAILSPSNQVIFATSQHGHHHWMSTQQALVMVNGKWVGTVELSQPGKADPPAAIGAVLAVILAIVFVSFQMGRNVVQPLESMSRAALKIADGDLDFELAPSNTVEIKQVRTAFQVMVKGLRDSFAKQQKLEEERRFFIGAIAHDLRTPCLHCADISTA